MRKEFNKIVAKRVYKRFSNAGYDLSKPDIKAEVMEAIDRDICFYHKSQIAYDKAEAVLSSLGFNLFDYGYDEMLNDLSMEYFYGSKEKAEEFKAVEAALKEV